MSKHVIIAGIGMGSADLMTEQVKQDIGKAQVLIGAARMLDAAKKLCSSESGEECCASFCSQKKYVQSCLADDIARIIKEGSEQYYCVLMSGDTGFYSGTKKLADCLRQQVEDDSADSTYIQIHPGISALSYLCAAFGKDYNDVSLASMHGRKENIAYRVKTHRLTFLLTDGDGAGIAAHLCEYGLSDVILYVGYQLSYPEELLFSCRAGDYEKGSVKKNIAYSSADSAANNTVNNTANSTVNSTANSDKKCLLCMLIENENVMHPSQGFKDSEFIRGKVPMTKAQIRYQICGMLEAGPESVIYDIGSGTGSVAMELAKKVPDGKVYAIECNHEAVNLIEKNSRHFAMDQVHIVEGTAPEVLEELADADAVFIGGSKGRLLEILKTLKHKKRQDKMPVVISAITLETWHELIELTEKGTECILEDVEIMQMQISHSALLGSYHRLEPTGAVWLAKGYL